MYVALFFSMGCHTTKLVLYSKFFIINVMAEMERGKMAEITDQNAGSWSQKAGDTVPIKWKNEDTFLFNHSLSMLPYKLIFLTVG